MEIFGICSMCEETHSVQENPHVASCEDFAKAFASGEMSEEDVLAKLGQDDAGNVDEAAYLALESLLNDGGEEERRYVMAPHSPSHASHRNCIGVGSIPQAIVRE